MPGSSEVEEQRRRQQRQFENELHNRNVAGGAGDEFQSHKAQYLERLADSGMSDAGTRLLDNMIDKTFVLGNLSDAEVHEIKWRLQVMYLKIKARFPHQESDIQGELRAYYFDDPDENIEALSDAQKIIISQMLIGIGAYVSRSRHGFQQEQLVKQINVSEVRNPDEENEDGVIRGLMG